MVSSRLIQNITSSIVLPLYKNTIYYDNIFFLKKVVIELQIPMKFFRLLINDIYIIGTLVFDVLMNIAENGFGERF